MSKANDPQIQCSDCQSCHRSIFCDLAATELTELSKNKVHYTYKKGELLFSQGNMPEGIYCINSGNIKVTQIGSDGKETIVRVVGPGELFGHRSLFTQEENQGSAKSIQESNVCFFDKKYIVDFVKNNPSVALNLIEKLSRDLGAAEHKISSSYQKTVKQRLAELLLLLKESHGIEEEHGVRLDIKLSREEMASLVGTASETLIRFFSELKQQGIVDQQGKNIYILDSEALMDEAGIDF